MNNATLVYVINNGKTDKDLKLYSETLFNLDKYTCKYKNEDDFINNYHNREAIDKFVRENGKYGHVYVNYYKSVTEKEQILPLFNSSDIFVFKDDPYEGKITEVEKARRLLFNSKNQLFLKLILSLKVLGSCYYNLINISDKEADCLLQSGYKPVYINNDYYINYKSLFEYRAGVDKLGCIRRPYEEMLDSLKDRMVHLESNAYYYYNRQLRIAINMYQDMIQELFVSNLQIKILKKVEYKLCRGSL